MPTTSWPSSTPAGLSRAARGRRCRSTSRRADRPHRRHAAGAVDQRELVGVDVERGARRRRRGVSGTDAASSSRWEPHRDELARGHRQRAGQQPGQPGEQHRPGDAPPPMTPSTSARLLTSPSLAPKTAARNVPDTRARPRAASPRTTSSCIRSSAAIAGVASASGTGQPALGLLRQRQHEHPTEPPREDGQQPRPQGGAPGPAHLIAQPALPVRRVPLLGLGQPQQDLALLTVPAPRQIAVDPAASRSSANRRRHRRTLPCDGVVPDRPPSSCTTRSSQSTGSAASR